MSEMIERVAIAMREKYAEETGETPLVPFEKSGAREYWLVCARAAIEAMPTKAMLDYLEGQSPDTCSGGQYNRDLRAALT